MGAGEKDFEIEQGTTFIREITWQTGDPAAAVDITGYTIRLQAREDIDDATPVLDMNTGNSQIVITDAVNGKFELRLTAAESEALNFEGAIYDLECESGGGVVTRLLQGAITVLPEVTR